MPGGKSKKKPAGPVRGFATTSTPKIAKELPTPEPEKVEEATIATAPAAGTSSAAATANGNVARAEDELSAEEEELQRLAQLIKPNCDKDISRIVKVRPFASLLPLVV